MSEAASTSLGGSGKKKRKEDDGENSGEGGEQGDVVEEDSSIGCKCGSRLDDKGLMLCCEKCELWSHAACYRLKKTELPETFFCDKCVPPAQELLFDDVVDAELRALLERHRDAHGFRPGPLRRRVKPANEFVFRHEERLLLETYWKLYARLPEHERPLVAEQMGRLFSLPAEGLESHFVLMAEDVLDGTRNGETLKPLGGPSRSSAGNARQNTVTKSALGPRTTRASTPAAANADQVCGDGAGCSDEACHCRANLQECAAAGGSCLQCGCSLSTCRNGSLMNESRPAPHAVVPVEKSWKYVVVDAVLPGGFVCEVVGKVCDASVASKGYWNAPLRRDCREFFLNDLGLVWDLEKHGNDARFIRRSCRPSCVLRCLWVGSNLRLGVWAGSDGLQAGQEVTVGWDRAIDSLVSHVPCACDGKLLCPVRQWYGERERLALSFPVVPDRIGTRRMEPLRPNKLQAELETTLNPVVTPDHKLSREDRKLQQVLKTIEKLEKHEKQQKASSHSDPNSPAPRKRVKQSFDSETAASNGVGEAEGPSRERFMSLSEAAAPQPQQQNFQEVQQQQQQSQEPHEAPPLSPVSVPLVAEKEPVLSAAQAPVSSGTPQSVGKALGGKKAWLQKFSVDGGSCESLGPPVLMDGVDHAASPAYGWKKRAMLEAPEPFWVETLESDPKKQKE